MLSLLHISAFLVYDEYGTTFVPERKAPKIAKKTLEMLPKTSIRTPMKKLILSLVVVAFAVAVQAGDSKTCAGKDKTACTATKTSDAGCCSMAKGTACKAAPARQTLIRPQRTEQAPKLVTS